MTRALAFLAAASSLAVTIVIAQPAPPTDRELIDRLKEAAPAGIVNGASVLNEGADGKMKTIQEGSNGWTCMDPGGSPMCADQAAMAWVKAWQSKEPATNRLGFIYMLRGDNGASNTDPYALKETPDNNWIKTGSHVMIVGAEAKGMMANYPRGAKADPTKPYVMWPGTPYEHLMLPLK